MKCCRCANCHVGEGHIIVDGSNQANNFQVAVLFDLIVTNIAYSSFSAGYLRYKLLKWKLTIGPKRLDMFWPFRAEFVCAGERTISSTNNKGINSFLNEVSRGSQATLGGPKGRRACRSDERSSLPEPKI